jgi:threonine dehydratase
VTAAIVDPIDFNVSRLREVHRASSDLVRRTPVLSSRSLSEQVGGLVALKAENLQRTGSFKLRGALAKLSGIDVAESPGVVAGSAGNHAQSVAYAARARGLPCEIFMPAGASVSKLAAVRAFGATVTEGGASVDECIALAHARASETGMTFVHPFDDREIVEGQAGLGLELVDDVPDLARVVVPIGGGGLASGVAIAIKQQRPDVSVIGVQAAACAAYPGSLAAGSPVTVESAATMADGIAIKRPGELTLRLIDRWLDDCVTVEEDEIADAMTFLIERAKLVVEGAGAASLAALLSGAVVPAERGTTVAVLSGGNVDPGLLAAIVSRAETKAGRRARFYSRIEDRPGGLARLLAAVAETGANLIAVDHVRDGVELHVRETGVELTLETRGVEHTSEVARGLIDSGFHVVRLD